MYNIYIYYNIIIYKLLLPESFMQICKIEVNLDVDI